LTILFAVIIKAVTVAEPARWESKAIIEKKRLLYISIAEEGNRNPRREPRNTKKLPMRDSI